MSGNAALTTKLMSGVNQVETATVVCPTGAITAPGNLHIVTTTTALGVASPLTVIVAVLAADTTYGVVVKIVAGLNLDATFNAVLVAVQDGANVLVSKLAPVANEVAFNVDMHMDSGTGMTDDLTSTTSTDGQAFTEIAQVTNIGGPALALNTEDVTAHDSTGAWEEVVATIKRSGQVRLDLNYDPDGATHDATTGLIYKMDNQLLEPYQLRFPDAGHTEFDFNAYVVGFEPGAPHAGKLSASATFKIDGVPVLDATY